MTNISLVIKFIILFSIILCSCTEMQAKVLNFMTEGGSVNDGSLSACHDNKDVLEKIFENMNNGDTLLFPASGTFHFMGGIEAFQLNNVTIEINGKIEFSDNMKLWPRHKDGEKRVKDCMSFYECEDLTFTSSNVGVIDGKGNAWWGIPFIGYLQIGEDRPKLLYLYKNKRVLVEHLLLKDSPFWTFFAHYVDGLEVRYTEISARRNDADMHDMYNLSALNTDGFDVTGKNVWIHDCKVWNQDDTIAVKDDSENMLFERIEASGVGLTIGSIGNSTVRNITFRDCHMHKPFKGIYMKFREYGNITDVTYERIVIDEPEQWPIWIGPAQQTIPAERNLCSANPCSLCWPITKYSECNMPANSRYDNIKLIDITINNPKMSPGVIMGHPDTPLTNILFHNVVVNNPGINPWKELLFYCDGVDKATAVASGSTWPIPQCFTNKVSPALNHAHNQLVKRIKENELKEEAISDYIQMALR